MKTLVILAFALISSPLQAQSDSLQKGPWVLGGVFSPQYSYRSLNAEDGQRWQADVLDTLETPRYGYATGIMVGRAVGDKAFVEASLLFADKGQRIKQLGLWRNYADHYYFLDIPVSFRYNVFGNRSKFFASAGVNTSVALYNRTTYIDPAKTEKQSLTQTTQLSPVHFGVVAGLGVSSPISEHIDFRLTIAYRRALTATSDTPLQRQFWSIGADMGFTYRF